MVLNIPVGRNNPGVLPANAQVPGEWHAEGGAPY